MTEDIDDIKRELDEVRRLKEELQREVEDVRQQKADAINVKLMKFVVTQMQLEEAQTIDVEENHELHAPQEEQDM